jgi:hypothetical protein
MMPALVQPSSIGSAPDPVGDLTVQAELDPLSWLNVGNFESAGGDFIRRRRIWICQRIPNPGSNFLRPPSVSTALVCTTMSAP